jgi:hypothetical protein
LRTPDFDRWLVLFVVVKKHSKSFRPAMNMVGYGVNGNVEKLGHLAVTPPVRVNQNDANPLVRGQLRQDNSKINRVNERSRRFLSGKKDRSAPDPGPVSASGTLPNPK